jgi:hypothetical protein
LCKKINVILANIQGGHHQRATGTYHFHDGPLVGQTFVSKAAGSAALAGGQIGSPTRYWLDVIERCAARGLVLEVDAEIADGARLSGLGRP